MQPLKAVGKRRYRELRDSGYSHEQAFREVGKILTRQREIRNETRSIKPLAIDVKEKEIDPDEPIKLQPIRMKFRYNKRVVDNFTRKFDYGDMEKDEFMSSHDTDSVEMMRDMRHQERTEQAKHYSKWREMIKN